MVLDFYYWSFQCPLNNRVINILKNYQDKIQVNFYDVDYMLAKKMNMFFPSLIVLNKTYRYFNPLFNNTFLDMVLSGKVHKDRPYLPEQGIVEKSVNIIPLTIDNLNIACKCTGQKCDDSYISKKKFLDSFDLDIYGFINVDEEDNLLGGAEFVPSKIVPYNIPKDDKTAFITCVYTTHHYFDYKSGPLKKLEEYLLSKYNQVLVISDEKGVFPNGDINFFLRNGYKDCGIISEERDYCRLHLLEKKL